MNVVTMFVVTVEGFQMVVVETASTGVVMVLLIVLLVGGKYYRSGRRFWSWSRRRLRSRLVRPLRASSNSSQASWSASSSFSLALSLEWSY